MKVFLVEDEYIVREGIKNNVDWAAHGFTFCGEAGDGELAFPMIKKEKPDIVITDIRMPFMDGLELSRLIKKELPQVKIMILSGYEEFEYAKSAIQIGIEEYLLKPINGEELLQAVSRVADKIREEQESAGNLQKYQRDSIENLEIAKRELFNDLISNEPTLSEIIDRGKELELELTAECYNILLLKLQRQNRVGSFSEKIVEITDEVIAFAKKHPAQMISFDRSPEGRAFLFLGENETAIENNITTFFDFFSQLIEGYPDIGYFGSVGKAVSRLREIAVSYETASHAFAYRFLSDGSGVIRYEDMKDHGRQEKLSEECLIGRVDTANLDKRKIEEFLKGGETSEIRYFVEEYIRNIGAEGNDSLLFRQYIVMDMYFAAVHFLKQIDKDETLRIEEPFQSPEQMQEIISRLETTMEYIVDLFRQVMGVRDRQTLEHNNDVVERARQYIREHYCDEELTLNMVASEVNISPNHLSAMFSQKTGQTFVKYLTDVRMNRAKELLKCTNKRSGEISEEIGYKDPHYFSYLFKKTSGMHANPVQGEERHMKKRKDFWIKRVLRRLVNWYQDLPMRRKISVSFIVMLVPMIVLVGMWFYNVLQYNEHYSRTVRNTSIVSEFSLDFKKNYDYKIYLVIVGNKSYESQKPVEDIASARRIISQVRNTSENSDSIQRIQITARYLNKLEKYTNQIYQNILKGGMYDENKEIWERDIQMVTASIQENILEILYYENKQGAIIYNEMQHMTVNMIVISIVIVIFLVVVTALMILVFPRTITRPVNELSKVTERVAGGDLAVRAHIRHGVELKEFGNSLNAMIEKISSLIERETENQASLREAELEILQMQINPHFLYNTLDTIVWMAEAGDRQAVIEMVQTLSEFFRSSLNNGRDIVPISSEARHIVSYMQIQKVRYQDILDYEIQIPEELNDCQIPRITLQPLVENALYHGIKHKRGKGKIRVIGRLEDECCVLVVEDNGIGMSEERLRHVQDGLTHKQEGENDYYGLYNVNERIRLKFGLSFGLTIVSVYQKGTRVEVRLPRGETVSRT